MQLSVNNHTSLSDVYRDVQAGQGDDDCRHQPVSIPFHLPSTLVLTIWQTKTRSVLTGIIGTHNLMLPQDPSR